MQWCEFASTAAARCEFVRSSRQQIMSSAAVSRRGSLPKIQQWTKHRGVRNAKSAQVCVCGKCICGSKRHQCPIHHGVVVAMGPKDTPTTLYQTNYQHKPPIQRGLKPQLELYPRYPVEPMDLLTVHKQEYIKFPRIDRPKGFKPEEIRNHSAPLDSTTSYNVDYPPRALRPNIRQYEDRQAALIAHANKNLAPFQSQTVYQSEYMMKRVPTMVRYGDKNEHMYRPSSIKFSGITEAQEQFCGTRGEPAQCCRPIEMSCRSTDPILGNTTYRDEFPTRKMPSRDICPAELLLA